MCIPSVMQSFEALYLPGGWRACLIPAAAFPGPAYILQEPRSPTPAAQAAHRVLWCARGCFRGQRVPNRDAGTTLAQLVGSAASGRWHWCTRERRLCPSQRGGLSPPKGGSTMIASQGAHQGQPSSRSTRRPRPPRLYTPTPDGYERFLRVCVGLPMERPRPTRPPRAPRHGASRRRSRARP
jgi:hypothetical protein